MTFEEFDLDKNNHFVAMEYYNLFLNRTFLVLITKKYLIGIKANGMISVEGGGNILTEKITSFWAVRGNLQNPYSYLKESFFQKIENTDLLSADFLSENKSNFIIERSNILTVYHDSKKKWGMGYYPHDGKIYVKTIDNREREFILLGSQSGERIVSLLTAV